MPIDPFQSTSYQVGRILNALTDDVNGNLILSDLLNPAGVTLTQLINNLLASNIVFNPDGTFYDGALTVQHALQELNQFAYLANLGKFIYVDATIPDNKVIDGVIYNNVYDAALWANGLRYNGYNTTNILVMGCHKSQGTLDSTTELGIYETEYSALFNPVVLKQNGIRIIGIGDPVIRMKNFIGTSLNQLYYFNVDTDGTNHNISILLQDLTFEFENCQYASAIKVDNAPINKTNKERSGLFINNVKVSFINGTNDNNRLIDVQTSSTKYASNIVITGLTMGSIVNTTPSINEIEFIYIDHHADTVVTINNLTFGMANQPNSTYNLTSSNLTSFTGVKLLNGNVVLNNTTLDEKFYWNGVTFGNVYTKLIKAYNSSIASISNLNIIRNSYNTLIEGAGGITIIQDWIQKFDNAIINVFGFDEVFNINVLSIQSSGTSGVGTSGTSGVGTSGTSGTSVLYDVKPVKSFWNQENFAFGIGHKNEIRLGSVTNLQALEFAQYSTRYGVPIWFNSDKTYLQYFNGTRIVDLKDSINTVYEQTVTTAEMSGIIYQFPPEAPVSGYEVYINHNLNLTTSTSFILATYHTSTGREVQPQEVIAISNNQIRLIMGTNDEVKVSLVGF